MLKVLYMLFYEVLTVILDTYRYPTVRDAIGLYASRPLFQEPLLQIRMVSAGATRFLWDPHPLDPHE